MRDARRPDAVAARIACRRCRGERGDDAREAGRVSGGDRELADGAGAPVIGRAPYALRPAPRRADERAAFRAPQGDRPRWSDRWCRCDRTRDRPRDGCSVRQCVGSLHVRADRGHHHAGIDVDQREPGHRHAQPGIDHDAPVQHAVEDLAQVGLGGDSFYGHACTHCKAGAAHRRSGGCGCVRRTAALRFPACYGARRNTRSWATPLGSPSSRPLGRQLGGRILQRPLPLRGGIQ
jgi:hypothetical protein